MSLGAAASSSRMPMGVVAAGYNQRGGVRACVRRPPRCAGYAASGRAPLDSARSRVVCSAHRWWHVVCVIDMIVVSVLLVSRLTPPVLGGTAVAVCQVRKPRASRCATVSKVTTARTVPHLTQGAGCGNRKPGRRTRGVGRVAGCGRHLTHGSGCGKRERKTNGTRLAYLTQDAGCGRGEVRYQPEYQGQSRYQPEYTTTNRKTRDARKSNGSHLSVLGWGAQISGVVCGPCAVSPDYHGL